jgi:hypothetical protein
MNKRIAKQEDEIKNKLFFFYSPWQRKFPFSLMGSNHEIWFFIFFDPLFVLRQNLTEIYF